MARLTGAVAVVSGGARGMGAEHVRGLVAEGAKVVFGDVLDDEGKAVAASLGDAARYVHLDVTSEADWSHAITEAETAFGPVTILVNNAGILAFGSVETMSVADFRKVIDVNLTGTFLGMHATIPSLKKAGGGVIVNIVDVHAQRGVDGACSLQSFQCVLRHSQNSKLIARRRNVGTRLRHFGFPAAQFGGADHAGV